MLIYKTFVQFLKFAQQLKRLHININKLNIYSFSFKDLTDHTDNSYNFLIYLHFSKNKFVISKNLISQTLINFNLAIELLQIFKFVETCFLYASPLHQIVVYVTEKRIKGTIFI